MVGDEGVLDVRLIQFGHRLINPDLGNTAGSETTDAHLTGFVFETRGANAGALKILGRKKYIHVGTETGWDVWQAEGEQMLGDVNHPYEPFSQVEFTVGFPHLSTFYDIEYRVYEAATGWQAWACGGETAGTDVQSDRNPSTVKCAMRRSA